MTGMIDSNNDASMNPTVAFRVTDTQSVIVSWVRSLWAEGGVVMAWSILLNTVFCNRFR